MIADVAAVLGTNLMYLAAGLGLTRAVGLWRAPRAGVSWLPVAYMVGVGAVGVACTLELIAGWSLQFWQAAATCGALALAGALPSSSEEDGAGERGSRRPSPLAVALTVLLALVVAECAYQALDTWDAWAMWTMKARALVLLGGLDPHLFASSAYTGAHLDYPLLLPTVQAVAFRAMSSLNTQVVHMQSALLLAGWIAASARLLRGRGERALVLPALGLAAVAPATLSLIEEGYADIPGALFMALAGLCAWLYLDTPRLHWAGCTAVFAAAGASTKREAWTFALGLFVVAIVYARVRKRPIVPLVGGLALVAATIGAWLGWLAAHGVTGHDDEPISKSLNPAYLGHRITRAIKAVYWLANYSARPSLWLILLPLTVLVAALALRRGGRRDVAWFFAPLFVLQYAALVWAFWISKAPIQWHLDHAAPRVVSTPLFLGASFIPLLVRRG